MQVSWEHFRLIYYHAAALILTIIILAGMLYSVAHNINIKESWELLTILLLASISAYFLTPRISIFIIAAIFYLIAFHSDIKDWEGYVILIFATMSAYLLSPRILFFLFRLTCPLCQSKEIQCELILYQSNFHCDECGLSDFKQIPSLGRHSQYKPYRQTNNHPPKYPDRIIRYQAQHLRLFHLEQYKSIKEL